MENKDKEEVYAKVNSSLKLIIRRYADKVSYCKIKKNPMLKELAYFEKELIFNSTSNS